MGAFGNLLGGMVEGMGQRMHEEKQQQHTEELWKQGMIFNLISEKLHSGDITPEEEHGLLRTLDDTFKTKGQFAALGHFGTHLMSNIAHPTPPEQVAPPPQGAGVQTAGMAPPESVMAPAPAIPRPGAQAGIQTQPEATEGIMPPMPERPPTQVGAQMTPEGQSKVPPMPQMPTATGMQPGMTLNQIRMQRQIAEIKASPDMSDEEKHAAIGKLHGILPYETAMARAGATANAPLKFLNNQPFVVKNANGPDKFIWHTNHGPMITTPQGPVPYVPEPGDSPVAKSTTGKGFLKQDVNKEWQYIEPGAGEGGAMKVTPTGVKGPANAANAPTITVKTRDAKGNTITKVMTKEDALKESKEKGGIIGPPPAMTQNRITAADNSIRMGNTLIGMLESPEVQAALGPFAGRATDLDTWIRGLPESMSRFKGALQSWTKLQPAVHGMRASEMAEHIEKSLPNKMTPQAIQEFIKGYNDTAKVVSESEAEDPEKSEEETKGEEIWTGKPRAAAGEGGATKPTKPGAASLPAPQAYPFYVTVEGETGEPIRVDDDADWKHIQTFGAANSLKLKTVPAPGKKVPMTVTAGKE